jgi:hypothetical protein
MRVTPIDMWNGSQFIGAIPGPAIRPKATANWTASAATVDQCSRRTPTGQRWSGAFTAIFGGLSPRYAGV